jgi:hypothetical protein
VTPRNNRSLGLTVVIALWVAAIVCFFVTATMGARAFRAGHVASGVCIIAAGVLVAYDWMGVATIMGQRTARRWRGRVRAQEASNPATATRSTRLLAGWWIGFGALIVVLGLTALH